MTTPLTFAGVLGPDADGQVWLRVTDECSDSLLAVPSDLVARVLQHRDAITPLDPMQTGLLRFRLGGAEGEIISLSAVAP